MTLHPQAQALCDLVNAATAGSPPPGDETLQQARDGLALLYATGAGLPEEVHSVGDVDAGGVPVRVYRPSAGGGLPVVVFFHGGGWTLANVDVYDATARAVARATGAAVASVDYRLAPEHPFPAPLDDCWNALRWIAQHAGDLGADASRLVVMGDSAGGNLAAVCSLLARDEGAPEIALQVLIYPVVDTSFDAPSYAENGTGCVLEERQMRWFLDCYTRGGADPADWRIAPLRAPDLSGVAPALVITAEHDPLRDEGEAYAKRLAEAGVAVELRRYEGMVHPFFSLPALFDDARVALEQVAAAVRRAVS